MISKGFLMFNWYIKGMITLMITNDILVRLSDNKRKYFSENVSEYTRDCY